MDSETICSQCKRVRGKSAKPWRECSSCHKDLCLHCKPSRTPDSEVRCWDCSKRAYEEEEKIRKATPIECKGCKGLFLPDDMEYHYWLGCHSVRLCKPCISVVQNLRDFERREGKKLKAKPGLVEVVFGVCPKPQEDGGHGYSRTFSYRKGNLDLSLGDIVLLPASWLDREIHGKHDKHEGTVVSTYSDYDGETSSIVSLVRKG